MSIRCRLGLHKKRWVGDPNKHAENCGCDFEAAYTHCGQEIKCVRCGKEYPFDDHWRE